MERDSVAEASGCHVCPPTVSKHDAATDGGWSPGCCSSKSDDGGGGPTSRIQSLAVHGIQLLYAHPAQQFNIFGLDGRQWWWWCHCLKAAIENLPDQEP